MSSKKLIAALSASAMVVTLAFSATASAQSAAMEKAGAAQTSHERKIKVLAENDKLQVLDVVYQPGDTGAVSSKDGLAVYHLSSGTIERSYADGSKQIVIYRAGQTMIIAEKRPYSTKNIGTTAVHEIVVQLK